jgi:hypothetical protein
MFEESPEAFINHWRSHAATATIFSRVEGSPLLEFEVDAVILQALDRTTPYLAGPRPATLIIHPVTDEVRRLAGAEEGIEVTGIARGRVRGRITVREDPFLVVHAGVPLVVGVLGGLDPALKEGDYVTFQIQPPLHAFVISDPGRRVLPHRLSETAT